MLCLVLLPLRAEAVMVDGAFTASDNYSVVFDVSFVENGQQLDGGMLAFGEDAVGQYLYFAMPTDFVDNSYGVGCIEKGPKNTCLTYGTDNSIGWGSHTHTFEELVSSDNAAFTFHTASSDVFAVLDYTAGVTNVNNYDPTTSADPTKDFGSCGAGYDDGNPATVNDADYTNQCNNASSNGGTAPSANASQVVVDVASSLEYNLTLYGGQTISTGEYVTQVSPYADPNYGNVEAGFENWIYELAYEIQFAPNTFDPNAWSTVTADTIMSLVEINEPHASPAKLGDGTPDLVCFACTVPVAGPLWLLLPGFVGLFVSRRRRAAAAA